MTRFLVLLSELLDLQPVAELPFCLRLWFTVWNLQPKEESGCVSQINVLNWCSATNWGDQDISHRLQLVVCEPGLGPEDTPLHFAWLLAAASDCTDRSSGSHRAGQAEKSLSVITTWFIRREASVPNKSGSVTSRFWNINKIQFSLS